MLQKFDPTRCVLRADRTNSPNQLPAGPEPVVPLAKIVALFAADPNARELARKAIEPQESDQPKP